LLASTTSFGGVNRITQNGSGDVTLLTSGNSNLTVPIIVNNGTGDVIVAAGSNIAAGTGTGGQVRTVSGNTITQNSTGRTLIYTGQTSGTGQLSHLSSDFDQLYYQGSPLTLNAKFNTAFGGSTIAGANAQVLFREASVPTFTLELPTLTLNKTYGDADPDVLAALQLAYTGPATLTSLVPTSGGGNNSFSFSATDALASINSTRSFNENVSLTPYSFNLQGGLNTTLTGPQPTLLITPASLTIKVNDSAVFVTRDPNSATDMGVSYFGLVNGDTAATALTGSFFRTYGNPTAVDPNQPNPGIYQGVFSISSTPTANHGNYDITLVKGDLTVLAADVLLITINSQAVTYGELTFADQGKALAGTISAQYCTNRDCTVPLSSLTVSPPPPNGVEDSSNQWLATDTLGASITFNTTWLGGSFSTGNFLNAGYYRLETSNIPSLAALQPNFVSAYTNGGVLTVNPLTLTAFASASDKTFDGTTQATISSFSTSPLLADDVATASYVSANFDSASAGNNKTVTVSGLRLSGADSTNYRFASPLLQTTASIFPGPSEGYKPQPPVVKPVIPGPFSPRPNGGGQTSLDDASGTNSNPFSLSVEADDCRLDNLAACECEPNPIDETMDICYVPNRSGQASAASPRS
jgi:hypothetical protein